MTPYASMMSTAFQELCTTRRSTRYFSNTRSIDRATIEKLIATAHTSPSVENTQPWRFHVMTNQDMKKALMEYTCYGNFIAGAAVFVVITCDRAAHAKARAPIWNLKELEYSCAGAMNTMMLAASAEGIASCWVSLHHGPVHNLLRITDHQTVVGGIMLGYPREGEEESSGDHERMSVGDTITWHDAMK